MCACRVMLCAPIARYSVRCPARPLRDCFLRCFGCLLLVEASKKSPQVLVQVLAFVRCSVRCCALFCALFCAVAACSVHCSARLRAVLRTCCALFCMFVLRRYVRLSDAALRTYCALFCALSHAPLLRTVLYVCFASLRAPVGCCSAHLLRAVLCAVPRARCMTVF